MSVLAQRYEQDADLSQLRDHPRNPRRGDQSSVAASLDRNGWYGAIIAQEESCLILAGHTRRRALTSAGVASAPVLWVKCDDETATRILLADNRTAELASWDNDALESLLAGLDTLDGTGFQPVDLDELGKTPAEPPSAEKYTRAMDAPHYQPTGTQPPVSELFDETRTAQLLASIEDAPVPDDVKRFLALAAHRHTVFRYDKVADFYADAEPAVQRLMEDSALVIVDVDDAIRLGYVKLSGDLEDIWEASAPDEVEDE